MLPGYLTRPIRGQEQRGHLGQLAGESAQEVEGGRVGPVQVIEEEHEWLTRREGGEVVAHAPDDGRLVGQLLTYPLRGYEHRREQW